MLVYELPRQESSEQPESGVGRKCGNDGIHELSPGRSSVCPYRVDVDEHEHDDPDGRIVGQARKELFHSCLPERRLDLGAQYPGVEV